MSKRKKGRVDMRMAIVIIATALVLAVGVVLLFVGERSGQKPETTQPQQTEPQGTIDLSTLPEGTIPVVVPEQTAYEYWLCANMVMGLTLEYPDFQQPELFIAGETAQKDRMESRGAWIRFVSGGETIVIHSQPLAQERTEAGTRDIYSTQTQFATYDVVEDADLSGLTQLTLEDISNELIHISLPSVYQH